jgi:hypothetical protein
LPFGKRRTTLQYIREYGAHKRREKNKIGGEKGKRKKEKN